MVDFDNTQQQHGMEANREQSVDSRAETHLNCKIVWRTR